MMVWDVRCPAIMCNRSHTAYQAPVLAVQVCILSHEILCYCLTDSNYYYYYFYYYYSHYYYYTPIQATVGVGASQQPLCSLYIQDLQVLFQ